MRASWGEATLPSINRLHLARCQQPRVQERGAQPFERTDFPRQRKEDTHRSVASPREYRSRTFSNARCPSPGRTCGHAIRCLRAAWLVLQGDSDHPVEDAKEIP